MKKAISPNTNAGISCHHTLQPLEMCTTFQISHNMLHKIGQVANNNDVTHTYGHEINIQAHMNNFN